MMDLFKKHLFAWILPSLILLATTAVYFAPVVFGDKQIAQDDILMGLAKGREIVEFRAEQGGEPLWTNAMFSGMPTFQIATDYPNNGLSYVQGILSTLLIEKSGIYIIVSLMIGFFALLRTEGVRMPLAVVGALAFGFSAFFIISLGAGHNAKVRTAAYMAPLLMGVLLTLRGRLWLGFALTALFTGLSIHANHFQVTYYTAIPVLAMIVAFAVAALRSGELGAWGKRTALLAVAALIGMGPNAGNLWSSYAYTQESMRGGHSALTATDGEESQGLDFDYAMSWSYGVGETVNLFVPNATGGGSKQSYEGTQTVDFLTQNFQNQGMNKAQAERTANQYAGQILYSGDQSMVNGAYYVGAIVFFLFVIGLMLVRGPLLWGSLGALALALLMAWGKNAAWFNEFLFQHLPLYNKFRVPSMSLVVAFVVLPLIGFKGLELLLQKERAEATKALLRAVYIVGGLAAVLWVLGSSLLGVDGANDTMWTQQGLNLDMILDDRKALLRSSALRSLIFVVLAAAAIWLHITRKIKMEYLAVALGLLVLVDLWGFDKDQLGEDDLISERNLAKQQEPTATDLFILKDADPHYRVLNTTVSLTSDAYTSAFHKSVGGYHGAKLARYQDLITEQMSKGNMAVFSMLNAKWFIVDNGQGGTTAQVNPNACGHAWFPNEIKLVSGAKEAMTALTDFEPLQTAIVESDFIPAEQADAWVDKLPLPGDSSQASVVLTSYAPNRMVYQVSGLEKDQLAVFSEIFYQAPGQAWTATANGEALEILRADYLLRATVLPAGCTEVVFEFRPDTYYTGEKLDLAFSLLLLIAIGGAVFVETKKA
ncbi:MAG: hypothetical protein RLZZ02_637 [Bacteroidota bacterium]